MKLWHLIIFQKCLFLITKIKQGKKRLESKPEGVFTHYTALFPDCFIHQHLKMQTSPLGNQDCSREDGASGGVDTRCSRLETAAESRAVSQSVTLLRIELEVLHDLAEGLFVLDDPGRRENSSGFRAQFYHAN